MAREIHHRQSYGRATLDERTAGTDPMELFHAWLNEAEADGLPEPHAMVLSTTGANGPSSRIVLLRSFDAAGFVFFTNYNSPKALDMETDARAALLFFWQPHERQVRIEGTVARLPEEGSEAYFASRPRGSRIGAWASDQSARIRDREALDEKYRRWQERFLEDAIPRPMHWGGYVVRPVRIEFWQGRDDRMHDRLLFQRAEGDAWSRVRLQP
jgi:pyridoxamine 5'-phosphate oxidase